MASAVAVPQRSALRNKLSVWRRTRKKNLQLTDCHGISQRSFAGSVKRPTLDRLCRPPGRAEAERGDRPVAVIPSRQARNLGSSRKRGPSTDMPAIPRFARNDTTLSGCLRFLA